MDSLQDAIDSVNKAKKIASECIYRPKYHFLAPANWMNDPNGPIFYKGEYHLFYQHNPYDDNWGHIHWGHAKSKDLVHWKHLPIALVPSTKSGEEHCFSGSCVNNDGIPSILYTSIGPNKRPETGAEQWLALSEDDMMSWRKYSSNPIMTLKIHGNLDVREWRDPYVWREDDHWYMVLGGHIHNSEKGVVLLYKSSDLIHWTYLNPLCEGKNVDKKTRRNWECPNFFPLGNKYILIVSPHNKVVYSVGSYENYKFTPEEWNYLDHGYVFYAPMTMLDSKKRRLMWAWIRDGGEGGWNGCLTLPRVLTLGADNKLRFKPAPELQILRKECTHMEDIILSEEVSNLFNNIQTNSLEILLELEFIDAKSFKLQFFQPDENKKVDTIGIDIKKGKFWAGKEKGKIDFLNHEKRFLLHIFIDRSVIEVFLNYRECLTSRMYYSSETAKNLIFFIAEGKIKINYLDIWKIESIW
ncbi:MAG: glycoside hydrolase family 32 protein [Candidatus Hermodarchaeota archaeon]